MSATHVIVDGKLFVSAEIILKADVVTQAMADFAIGMGGDETAKNAAFAAAWHQTIKWVRSIK